ncbi:MAG: IPT/TIG domain-containing protein, partial [Dysgonamonadaceae bacterium]|nr:IPT/TIG domain-containing protein [Dysgonamonadaceae bacterium]
LKDVEITTGGNTLILDDAYKYVHPVNDFYVSNISPIIGSAGDVLELTGNKLGASDISKIEVGGNDCPIIPATQTSTYCECTLQDHPAGEVDITITTSSKTYRFAKVFEYQ